MDISLIKNEISKINKLEKEHTNVNIINAGLLKAGKSELFNAILGREEFETGVVRTTIVNKEVKTGNYNLIDTPGLDANLDDDKTAFEGYKKADIIVFVHNAIDGELNRIEIDAIQKIIDTFGDKNVFLESCILVISHIDQIENKKEIIDIVNNQLIKAFGKTCRFVVGVNSVGYIKGQNEDKKLLVEASNVKELIAAILDLARQGTDCFKNSIDKLKKEQLGVIDKAIKQLQQEQVKINSQSKVNSKDVDDAKAKITSIINKANSYSTSMDKIRVDSISRSALGSSRSYRSYKSRSQAKSDATSACNSAISNAASLAKTNGAVISAKYEEEAMNCKSLKLKLMEDYSEIKEIYYKVCQKTLPALNFTPLDRNSLNKQQLDTIKFCKEHVSYIGRDTFRSPDSYFNAYSSNLYIDEDYEEEYVSGRFGGKYKNVRVYTWDIDGALDDVCSDYKEILEYRLDSVHEVCNEIYKKYAPQMIAEYKSKVQDVANNLAAEASKASSVDKLAEAQLQKIISDIKELEELKKLLV